MISPHRLLPDRSYRSYKIYLTARDKCPMNKFIGSGKAAFIEELTASGLRGRGGAGFPTGRKWQTLFQHECPTRYVVCNAAEGEPGTFKDRFLLRKNPYAVLEGMAIALEVIGAKEAYIAIKSSFETEIDRLRKAIEEMKDAGFFKNRPLYLVKGPEEYLFGEEKALLNVIENKGPFPRTPEEPPYEVGLFSTPDSPNPALVNNVQTFAHVATIARHGAESFRKVGTADTPGTILFTVSGDVAKPGIYEVEAGIPINKLLKEYGGGPKRGRHWKALLPGVSTSVLTAEQFDTPASFDALKEAGSGLASAGFIVIDDATAIPPVARAVTRFLYVESCNQCFACKTGLRHASVGLEDSRTQALTDGKVVEIKEAAESSPQGNRCYLPVQGAMLVPSLFKNFREEFNETSAAEWMLPKFTDFDEKKGIFIYDEQQARKQPDWTFLEEG